MTIPTNWHLTPAGPCGYHLIGTDAAGKPTFIAYTYEHVDSHEVDEKIANLIAAAPELLEALKRLLAHDIENNGCTEPWPELCESAMVARSIVAKAEGKTQ